MNLLMCFYNCSSEEDSKGVVILIDCRKSSQMMVIKALIEKIAVSLFYLV